MWMNLVCVHVMSCLCIDKWAPWRSYIDYIYYVRVCVCGNYPAVDGNYCLTCGSDKSVKLWNPHSGLLLKTYMGHGQEVLDADRSDGRRKSLHCCMHAASCGVNVCTYACVYP